MSRIGEKPTRRKRARRNPLCSCLHWPKILFEMPSRKNIIPWGAIRKNTYNGIHCGNKGMKISMSWWIYSIPWAQCWVSNIHRNIWYWSTTIVCTCVFRRKWCSSTSPCLVRHTGMLPRLRKMSKRRSETLDLKIRSKGKVPLNHRTKDKDNAGHLETTHQRLREIITPWSQRRKTRNGMSSIVALLTTKVSVRPSSHWWPSWMILNQMHAPTLNQNLKIEMTKGSILSMRIPTPSPPPWRSRRRNHKI